MRLVNPSAPLAVKVRLKKVQIPAHRAISRIANTTTHRWLRIYSRPPIWSMSVSTGCGRLNGSVPMMESTMARITCGVRELNTVYNMDVMTARKKYK